MNVSLIPVPPTADRQTIITDLATIIAATAKATGADRELGLDAAMKGIALLFIDAGYRPAEIGIAMTKRGGALYLAGAGEANAAKLFGELTSEYMEVRGNGH